METRYTRVDTGGMGWRPIIESYPYRGTANVIVVVAILLCLRILYGGVLYTLASSLMLRIRNLQDRTPSVANQEDDLKWMGRFGTWKYIPNRYQAFVASVVSAFLYLNVFRILFTPTDAADRACGSLFRPILDSESKGDPVGWIWNIVGDSSNARCPRTMDGLYFEFFASFLALAICGIVLRRSIKRAQQ